MRTQISLGLCWDINTDTFTFKAAVSDKRFTRRGVLSTVNSLFDPLGFVVPVTIQGRALLRELSAKVQDWDSELPEDKKGSWETWKKSLQDLSCLHIPRVVSFLRRLELGHRSGGLPESWLQRR